MHGILCILLLFLVVLFHLKKNRFWGIELQGKGKEGKEGIFEMIDFTNQ